MPHRKAGSPNWYLRPVVVLASGRERLPERSSGTHVKSLAEAMERTLQELPRMGYADLVVRYKAGEFNAEELHVAKLNGALEQLRARADDPPLADRLEAFRPKDARVAQGARRLPELITRVRQASGERGEPRRSWLTEPANILAVLEERRDGDGVKHNSVRRAEYRAVSDWLRLELGEARKREIMAAVRFGQQDDTREVVLRPDEIQALLREAGGPLAREALTVLLATGIDRGPLLRIRARDVAGEELQVRDTKTGARRRTIRLGPVAQAALRKAALLSGATGSERVFPWTVGQLRHRFEAAAERAGLRGEGTIGLRLKDLRGTFATYHLRAGGDIRELQHIMGHERRETTLRYVKRLAVGGGSMSDAEAEQGLRILFLEEAAG